MNHCIRAALAVTILICGGCSHPALREQVCQGPLADFDQRMESLARGLSPWAQVAPVEGFEPSRSLASEKVEGGSAPSGVGNGEEPLTQHDRESWMKLTREILKEVQSYLDPAMDDSRLASFRRRVSRLADHVVALHGYAMSGRPDRMQVEIAEVRQANAELRDEVCGN